MKGLKLLKNGQWQFRKRVPKDVKALIGKDEFIKWLGHCSARDAEERAAAYLTECMKAVHTARAETPSPSIEPDEHAKDVYERQKNYDNNPEVAEFGKDINSGYIAEAALDTCLISRGLKPQSDIGMHDDAREGLLIEGAKAGLLTRTKSHIKEFERIQIAELDSLTVSQYVSTIKNKFEPWFPILHKDTIDQFKVQRWVNQFFDEGNPLNGRTVRRHVRTARIYFNWLRSQGYTDLEDPFENISYPRTGTKGKKKPDRAYSEDMLIRLYEASHKDDTTRHALLIAAYTGMRIEEMFRVKKSDVMRIDLDGESRLYFELKDSKTEAGIRDVPINKVIQPIVEAMLKGTANEFLFEHGANNKHNKRSSATSKRFSRIKKSIGIEGAYVFHSLRNTFITKNSREGIGLEMNADMVGHGIQNMTHGLYRDTNPIEDMIRTADKHSYPQLEAAIADEVEALTRN